MTGQRRIRPATAVLLAAVLGGCTTTVEGTASPASSSTAAPTSETPQTTGPTGPTGPPVEVTPAPTSSTGRVLEAHRIAGVASLVTVVFPERSENCSPGPFSTAAALEAVYFTEGTAAPILDSWGFVAGWAQCGVAPDGGLASSVIVMELSDPESAALAATELAAAQATNGYQPASLPGSDAPALLASAAGQDDVQAFVPQGRMLVYVFHQAAAGQGLDGAARLVADQLGLLEGFTPTPQADVAALPADPQGLAALAVDPPGQFTDLSGPYDFEGYLRISIDPVRERELLTGNGFMGFYTKQSEEGASIYAVAVYTFGSTDQTNAVYDGFAELEQAAFGGTPFRLPAIPDAPCFVFDGGDGTFYQRCYVGFRTNLASVDVGGLAAPDDYARMNELLPAQRDRIDG